MSAAIHGTVFDSGGGEINIHVDRDTAEYPENGQRVVIYKFAGAPDYGVIWDQPADDTPRITAVRGPFGPNQCAQGIHDRQTDDGSCYTCGSPDPDAVIWPPSHDEMRRRWAVDAAVAWTANTPRTGYPDITRIADDFIAYILQSPETP